MATNSNLEFEFFLAAELGMFVSQLRRMSNAEFVEWKVYYSRKAQRDEVEMKKAKRASRRKR